ncbi:hypothetical protein GCM10009733_101700 [Nonomuraea maheshkhaliensis]|uniref:DUF4365 domain-containing protein n=1 Tax=Nonomuraea maheshkhaliensis TaxID=419590 RepID=A0ABP4TJX7_9ACTN
MITARRSVTPQHEGINKILTLDLDHTRQLLLALFDLPIAKSGAARLASPDLSEADPGVCRADGAILYGEKKGDRLGVIVETQRAEDETKRYAWLEYIANMRARERCPACLVVICPKGKVAKWASGDIPTGHPGLVLKPLVIHEGNTPVITDARQAAENIGLAVVSVVTQSEHPRFNDITAAVQAALDTIDRETAYRYARYISLSLEGDSQEEWGRGMRTKTYPYQGVYAECLVAEGEVKGEVKGEAKSVLKVLDMRGLVVSDEVRERVMDCLDEAILDGWLQRALKVDSAEELFL